MMLTHMCHKNQSSACMSCCLLLSHYTSVINPFNPVLLHLTRFKSMAHVIRLSRSIYFLYRCLEVVTTHVRVIRSWCCVYMAIHTHVCQDIYVFTYAWFCVCFISHKHVTCYTFCVRLSWGWLVLYHFLISNSIHTYVHTYTYTYIHVI